MVYRVEATNNDYDHILVDHRDRPAVGSVGAQMPPDWSPPALMLGRGRKKIRPNIMAYDQGAAFAVDEVAVAQLNLDTADWCRLVPVHVEATDLRGKPVGPVAFTLLAVTRLIDAVDRERTTFKAFGDEILLDDAPEQTFFHQDRLPPAGMFHHKSGAATCILTHGDGPDSFRSRYENAGLTGLRFIALGQGV